MIFENEKERIAFEFIAEIADDRMSNAGSNDLSFDMFKKFSSEKIERHDNNTTTYMDSIKYDFDILHWLKQRTRKGIEEMK